MKKMNKATKWTLLLVALATLVHTFFLPSIQSEAISVNEELEETNRENNAIVLTDSSFIKAFDVYYQLIKKTDETMTIPKLYLKNSDALNDAEKASFTSSILDNIKNFGTTSDLLYYAVDNETGTSISNVTSFLAEKEVKLSDFMNEYEWFLCVDFDDNGVPVINYKYSSHPNHASTQNYYNAFNSIFSGDYGVSSNESSTSIYFEDSMSSFDYQPIKNVSFRFAVEAGYMDRNMITYVGYTYYPNDQMMNYFITIAFLMSLGVILLFMRCHDDPPYGFGLLKSGDVKAVLINGKEEVKQYALQFIPLEFVILADMIILGIASSLGEMISSIVPSAVILFLLYLFIAYSIWYYFLLIMEKNVKKHSLCAIAWKYLKTPAHRLYDYALHLDMTNKDTRRLFIIVFMNFLILGFLSTFYSFMTRVTLLIIYSVGLYFLLRKYIGSINKDYHGLLDVIRNIATGKTNNHMDDDIGIFNPFKPELKDIQTNIETAIAEEVHSQQMKTELITNVSHDLKTPLTSLISYIDLLKKDELSETDRKKYIDILDRSSSRLKHLVEDLFEVSKANSGNVQLDLMKMDIVSLMKQVQVECDDALKKRKLTIRNTFSDEKIILSLDSQKTYRIFENLISNIAKYAMKGTRVYIDIKDYDTFVEISLKNISAQELNFDADDITERFMRGDKSRNTEGSGLGLAIVKSFTELQNGNLKIQTDGDLFKVFIRFPKTEENKEEKEA